jgi:hypothetical protein
MLLKRIKEKKQFLARKEATPYNPQLNLEVYSRSLKTELGWYQWQHPKN